MKINISAGECLNKILQDKYRDEYFISFNEAMIEGEYSSKLFSKEFISERAITFNVSEEEYVSKLSSFLSFLENIESYNEVVLWFGDEPFCVCNRNVILKTLKEYKYVGNVILNIVDEITGNIIDSKRL